jgi:hypothetical protein
MAKPNYGLAKRQKEAARKERKQLKQARREARATSRGEAAVTGPAGDPQERDR